ncbi:hypothetical protein DFH07DRAFT_936997 [Mycena maculata]|uniref:Kelch repeat protein n=1 Tax=Mycena maculata TaxID=230809 RepID=A0AAD7K170_9AGAR|nr:hypothetical protein DFH07DRAFT_936997 [Mycena maculata]
MAFPICSSSPDTVNMEDHMLQDEALNRMMPVLMTQHFAKLSHSSCEGDQLFAVGQFAAAQATYYEEARKMVGPWCRIPAIGLGAMSKTYLSLDPLTRTNLMGCCLGMAQCLLRENQTELALSWLEEINSLHSVDYHNCETPMQDLTLLISSGLYLASEIFESLGNSGTAAMRRWTASTNAVSLGPRHLTPTVKAMQNRGRMVKLLESRHPDPKVTNVEVTVPALQVRGSWTRMNIKAGGVTEGRQDCSTFLWNGIQASFIQFPNEILGYASADPINMDAWQQLPDYPIPLQTSGIFLGRNIVVHNDIALLFTGRPTVDVFNLKSETWACFQTMYSPTATDLDAGVLDGWPYPGRTCMDAAMQILDNTLYIFGGSHGTTRMGCNLFMRNHPRHPGWRLLLPGAAQERGYLGQSGPDRARIYILFGHCDRDVAKPHELHGSDVAFAQTDFWSWSVKEAVWRQERVQGNPLCARTEMAHAYNAKLKQSVVFSGYHPGLPSQLIMNGQPGQFPYTYFADTFVFDMAPTESASNIDPAAPTWRHVGTPGFPTYCCQAHMQCDPATGWTNSQSIPRSSSHAALGPRVLLQIAPAPATGFYASKSLKRHHEKLSK